MPTPTSTMTTDSRVASVADFLAARDAGCVGFAQGSRLSTFFVVRRDGSAAQAIGHTGSAIDVTEAYDVRVFDAEHEWHWWWDQRGRQGRWAVLDDEVARARGWFRLHEEGTRLLRGEVMTVKDGWAQLHDGHSRPLWVPLGSQEIDHARPRSRVQIGAVEYASVDDPHDDSITHGNAGVAAERLTTMSVEPNHG